jgi:hypothetical protein
MSLSQREDPIAFPQKKHQIYMPLAGRDLYVTEDDLKNYFKATRQFWNEMITPLFDEMARQLNRP